MRVLYIAEVQWRSQISRKHQLIRRFPSDWYVFFASPMNAAPGENSLITRRERPGPTVDYVSLPLPKPDARLAPVRAATPLLGRLARARLASIASSFEPDVVICSYIWAHEAVAAIRRAGTPALYDLNDLHYEFYPDDPERAREAFRALVNGVDEVAASSSRLREIAGRGVVIGNGVDLDTFRGRESAPEPEEIARSPLGGREDLVMYVGSIDDRIDFAALERTVEMLASRPGSGVVCVGRIFDAVRDRVRRLEAAHPDRLLFTGRVDYKRLPSFLSRASVGIAPFALNEKTAAINPNKLYMYAAMDLNVVSTPFSDDVRQYAELVYLPTDADAFARAVNEALGDAERRRAVRSDIALSNSWDEKAREFIKLVKRLAGQDAC